jgi:uncharacterized protein (TIGR02118 family)
MTLKKIALLQPRKDLTREAFEHHWREIHGPLVSQSPGYLRYRLRYIQNQWLPAGPQGLPPTWAGVAEFWLPQDNEDEFAKTVIYQERIRPDEARFIDFDGTVSMTARETVILGGKGLFKLWLVSPPRSEAVLTENRSRALLSAARSNRSNRALSQISGWEINQVLPGAVTTPDLDWGVIHILRFDSLPQLEQALSAGLLDEGEGLHDVANVSFVTLERRFFDGQPMVPLRCADQRM